MEVEKNDNYVEMFMGSSYKIKGPGTVGQLRGILEGIIADLPEDDSLGISDLVLHKGEFYYVLNEGIPK